MEGKISSVEGFLTDLLMPILPNIGGNPMREAIIEIHQLTSRNAASNLRGGRYGHITLTMTADEYMSHTGCAFATPHNPVNEPPTMGTAQDQALRTKRFQQNQAIFRRCTTVEREVQKQIVMTVQSVFLYQLVDDSTSFGHVKVLQMLQQLFNPCR